MTKNKQDTGFWKKGGTFTHVYTTNDLRSCNLSGFCKFNTNYLPLMSLIFEVNVLKSLLLIALMN